MSLVSTFKTATVYFTCGMALTHGLFWLGRQIPTNVESRVASWSAGAQEPRYFLSEQREYLWGLYYKMRFIPISRVKLLPPQFVVDEKEKRASMETSDFVTSCVAFNFIKENNLEAACLTFIESFKEGKAVLEKLSPDDVDKVVQRFNEELSQANIENRADIISVLAVCERLNPNSFSDVFSSVNRDQLLSSMGAATKFDLDVTVACEAEGSADSVFKDVGVVPGVLSVSLKSPSQKMSFLMTPNQIVLEEGYALKNGAEFHVTKTYSEDGLKTEYGIWRDVGGYEVSSRGSLTVDNSRKRQKEAAFWAQRICTSVLSRKGPIIDLYEENELTSNERRGRGIMKLPYHFNPSSVPDAKL